MTLKRKNSKQLPKLDISIEQRVLREETPPDLKGAQYPHLPPVGHTNGTPSEEDEVLTLLPAIGEPHPYPYYISKPINLKTCISESIQIIQDIHEEHEVNETSEEKETYTTDGQPKRINSQSPNEGKVSEDLAIEKLQQLYLKAQTKASSSNDKAKSIDSEELARGVLDGPISDQDLEWLWPELDVQLRDIVWTIIDERVKLLPEIRPDEVNKKTPLLNEVQQSALFSRSFKKNYFYNSILNNVPLHSLINDSHCLTVSDKFMQNSVLQSFQDNVITQQLADIILDASLNQTELEVTKLEEEEKKLMPQRI